MLVWLKEKTGEPVASSTEAQGEPTLVAADG
jgi:hypothetical protein